MNTAVNPNHNTKSEIRKRHAISKLKRNGIPVSENKKLIVSFREPEVNPGNKLLGEIDYLMNYQGFKLATKKYFELVTGKKLVFNSGN